MKLRSANVTNFGSYNNLELNFLNNGGLILVSGSTGSGKSTLCDIVPWILFGRTSKGGAVDDIRTWDIDETTYGTLTFDNHTVTRARKPNDLTIDGRRGKDLQDTQNLINELIGMDYELYLAGAYMHEFSQTAQFFITTPKNRRALSEQLVDLSFAKNLAITAKDQLKELGTQLNELKSEFDKITAQYDTMLEMARYNDDTMKKWQQNINKDIRSHIAAYHSAEINWQRKVNVLHEEVDAIAETMPDHDDKCEKCGQNVDNGYHTAVKLIREKQQEIKYLRDSLLNNAKNTKKTIKALRAMNNPFKAAIDNGKLEALAAKLILLDEHIDKAKKQFNDLTLLQDILPQFRNILITDTISFLESKTNSLISDHFDGELSVSLKVESDDKLEVEIRKDGHICAYTQLSKGQRQILKLSFCVAVMESIENHHGIHLDTLFFDEAVSGLDSGLKTKAFTLLEKLSTRHSNVFVVEHDDSMKQLFTNKIEVSLVNGSSQLEKF